MGPHPGPGLSRTCLWAASALALVSACASLPSPAPRANLPPPTYAVEHLWGPCWPEDASPEERVTLTLIREGRTLRDVMFEPHDGASNSTGRCLRQVLWEYPWRADVPDTVEVSPPRRPPNGWATLEHVRLLSGAAGFTERRGVLDPIPLVHACVRHGAGLRPGVVFVVRTEPVRVSTFLGGPGQTLVPTAPANDSERCVQAVLASTVYPGPRTFRFDFSRGTPPGDPAPFSEVAAYFEPPNLTDATGEVDRGEVKAALAGLQPEISKCWEEALARRGGVAGARTLRLRVLPSGRLAFAQVVSERVSPVGVQAEAVDYLLDRCLVSAVMRAQIPQPRGGPAELGYSWVFALRQ
ncbi:MAG: hypothetical protein IRZ16_07965 [Myxococcaceae bacterium]|nr:hypothetical protein [Myxococcaceae bacterium]